MSLRDAGAKRGREGLESSQREVQTATENAPFTLYRLIALCAHTTNKSAIAAAGPGLAVSLSQLNGLQFLADMAYKQKKGCILFEQVTLDTLATRLQHSKSEQNVLAAMQDSFNDRQLEVIPDKASKFLNTIINTWRVTPGLTYMNLVRRTVALYLSGFGLRTDHAHQYDNFSVRYQEEEPTIQIKRIRWTKSETSTLVMTGAERAALLDTPNDGLLARFEAQLLTEYKKPGGALRAELDRCNSTYKKPSVFNITPKRDMFTIPLDVTNTNVEYAKDVPTIRFDFVVNTEEDGACLLHAYNLCINWISVHEYDQLFFSTSFQSYLGDLLHASPWNTKFRAFEDLRTLVIEDSLQKNIHPALASAIGLDQLAAGQLEALKKWKTLLNQFYHNDADPIATDIFFTPMEAAATKWANKGGELFVSLSASGSDRSDRIAFLYQCLAEGIRSTLTAGQLVAFPQLSINKGHCSLRDARDDISAQFKLYNRALVCLDTPLEEDGHYFYHYHVGILFKDPFEGLPAAERSERERTEELEIKQALELSQQAGGAADAELQEVIERSREEAELQKAIQLSLRPQVAFTDITA